MNAKTGMRLARVRDVREAPDATKHDPRASYARALADSTGLTHPQLAQRLGVGLRTIERWVATGGMPYPAQHALESLAAALAAEQGDE